MEKRTFQRLPVKLQSRLFYGNLVYTGMITNLSENGMFISTKMSFPVNSVFIAILLLNTHTISVPIRIRRSTREADQSTGSEVSGLGVGLINPSREYLDFVSKTRAALSNIHDDNVRSDSVNPSIDLS